jgi:hypothetical protein
VVDEAKDEGIRWQERVSEILDNYEKEVCRDSEYIPYEILDSNVMNEDSVEALYSKAEKWIEES